jgi:hypothetical protein
MVSVLTVNTLWIKDKTLFMSIISQFYVLFKKKCLILRPISIYC